MASTNIGKNSKLASEKALECFSEINGKKYYLTLDTNTYIGSQKKARFICEKYGEFWALPNSVFSMGVRHPKYSQYKKEQTCLLKYGVINPSKSAIIKEKMKKTNIEKYGVDNASKNETVKEKIKETNVKKYGGNAPLCSKKIKLKVQTTNLLKYGCYSPLQNEDVLSKVKSTNKEKYGYENVFQNEKIKEKGKVKRDITVQRLIKEGNWFKNKFGKTESKIRDLLNTLTENTFYQNYTILEGKELDMYSEPLNLAIEYCGLYWHNENSPEPRKRQYHNNKRIMCEKQGVRLITIFEDEWLNRQKQVINFLKSSIGKYVYKVYARNTVFKKITKGESRLFLEENHIQGYTKRSIHYFGLYYKDELLSVMTFGKHHRQGQDSLVLDRFAVKEDYHIPGGAGKLFKNACKILPKGRIISWSDNRWSQGNVYQKLGFALEEELPPDYSYVPKKNQNKIRLSKQSQQKSATKCPINLTEKEWANKRGLNRIWDCGKKRWIFEIK